MEGPEQAFRSRVSEKAGMFQAVKSDFVVQQLAVEIQYAEGMLYFDRSGQAQRAILRSLHAPFVPADMGPNVIVTGVHSPTEYLTVEFNRERLTIRQLAVATPVRVQDAAKESWDVLGDLLEVRKRVMHYGVRMLVSWAAESDAEVERAIVGAGLARETDIWANILGVPAKRSFIGIESKGQSDQIRCQVHCGSIKMEGTIPEELEAFRAEHALVFDLDWRTDLTKLESPTSLRGEDVKIRVRDTWKLVADKAKLVGEAIERWNSNQ